MPFGLGYIYAMTSGVIKKWWPKLKTTNFHFTSEQSIFYNCFSWAIGEINFWIDMSYFQIRYNLDPSNLDHSAKGYADCLTKYYGFEICSDGKLEEGMEKVVLYENHNKDWTHIARQLSNGYWTSKMGDFEDIEHYNVEALSGGLYGMPVIYMRRELATGK